MTPTAYPLALGREDFEQAYREDAQFGNMLKAIPEEFHEGAIDRAMFQNALGGLSNLVPSNLMGQAESYMRKALDVDGTKSSGGTTGGNALKIEDLMQTVAWATINSDQATFWQAINKRGAASTYVENTRVNDLGGIFGGSWADPTTITGGGQAKQANFVRSNEVIKWYVEDFTTTLPAELIAAQGFQGAPKPGNAGDMNALTRLQALILNLDTAALLGDADANPLEANGVLKMYREVHDRTSRKIRINCNGQPISQDTLENIAAAAYDLGFNINNGWWGPRTQADVKKGLYPYNRGSQGGSEALGMTLNGWFAEQINNDNPELVKIRKNRNLDPKLYASGSANSGAPAAPTTVTGALSTDSTGNTLDGGKLGNTPVWYWVKAHGIKGRSVATQLTNSGTPVSLSPNGGQKATLTITNGDADTKKFEVYCGYTNDPSKATLIGQVRADNIALNATTTFVDQGEVLPNCSTALFYKDEMLPDGSSLVMARQLLAPTRYLLPIAAFTRPCIWMSGNCFQLRAPEWGIVLENVGAAS